jgi:hypothetical protein
MSSRALRIGVLIGDSLVEEKILDASTPITLGQSLHCTLSVPIEAVPRDHVLFTVDDGRFLLHPTAAMEGRIGQGGEILPLSTIALERGARGKLVLGDATILFQEIAKPAPAPRAQLPASIRGTLADRIDRRLAAIIGGSVALHIGIAAWAWSGDAQAARYDQPLSSEFQQVTIDTPSLAQLAPPPTAPAVPGPGAATPVAPPRAITPPSRPALPALPPTMRADDALRMANILTTEETGHGYGGMSAHRPGTGLERELEEIQSNHREVTIGDDGRGPRKTSTRIDRDPHDLPIGDPNVTRLDPTKEPTTDRSRVKLTGAHTDDTTTLTPQAVLDLINTQYMAGLQRCYRRGLALDATLSGKVTLSLTVDESGKVTEPAAVGSDPQVDHCIQSLMGVWRFPIPHDAKGHPTDATFHISLALQPS